MIPPPPASAPLGPLPPARRGACPAFRAPMETGDGLILRLVPADGALTPAQLRGLADAARAFGNGMVEVTARGSLQVRGLKPETVAPLQDAVLALGITPRLGLPVDVSPLSGLDPRERADARPLAARIGAAAQALAERLGPKVSVVIDGGGAIPLDGRKADIRLVAAEGGWSLSIAGGTPHIIDTDSACARALEALAAIAARGRGARAADLLEQERAAALAQVADAHAGASCAGDTGSGPVAGRIVDGQALPSAGHGDQCGATAYAPCVQNALLAPGPVSGGQDPALPAAVPGAAQLNDRATADANPAHGGADAGAGVPSSALPPRTPASAPAAPLGAFPLADGSCAFGIGLPFGAGPAALVAAIADLAEAAGARDLRPAPERVLLVTGLAPAALPGFAEGAAALGLIVAAGDPRAAVAACPGAPACASAHFPARALAAEVARALAPLLDGSVSVHLSACTKGCARPASATLVLVGVDGGIALVHDGRAAEATGPVVAAEALPARLALLATAGQARPPGARGRDVLRRLDLPALWAPGSAFEPEAEP